MGVSTQSIFPVKENIDTDILNKLNSLLENENYKESLNLCIKEISNQKKELSDVKIVQKFMNM